MGRMLIIQLILLFCCNIELNSKEYDAQHKNCCFDAVIDILKLEDVV